MIPGRFGIVLVGFKRDYDYSTTIDLSWIGETRITFP